MIHITKTKQVKKYQMPEMPNFEHQRAKIVWLRRQKMLATISNIKSVRVQIKDIKQMIYSKNLGLISLYNRFYLNNSSSYDENDYITITKSTKQYKALIYALVSNDWLLDIEVLNNKSIEELQQEIIDLQNQIYELKHKKNKMIKQCDIDSKIKLLEYKLSCLSEFIVNKVNYDNKLSQTPKENKLLKN